jgi:flagellar biogenesis protein FliO
MAAQMAEEGMIFFQSWLNKPRATVRINASIPWASWMKFLRRPFTGAQGEMRTRIEVLDRLSLGGKKSLLLISIDGRRLLVGVGEDATPSVSMLEEVRPLSSWQPASRNRRALRAKRMVR